MANEHLSQPNPLQKCTFIVDYLTYLNQASCLVSPAKDSLGSQNFYLPPYATGDQPYYGVPDWYESPLEDNWIDLSNNIHNQTTFNWDSESFTQHNEDGQDTWYVELNINFNGHDRPHPALQEYYGLDGNSIPSVGEPRQLFTNNNAVAGLKDFSFQGNNPHRPDLFLYYKSIDSDGNVFSEDITPRGTSSNIGADYSGNHVNLPNDGSAFFKIIYNSSNSMPDNINQITLRFVYYNDPTPYSTVFTLSKFILGASFDLSYYGELGFTKSYSIESSDYIGSPISFMTTDPNDPHDHATINTFSQQTPGRRKWEIPYKNIKASELFAHNKGNKIISSISDFPSSLDNYIANDYVNSTDIPNTDVTITTSETYRGSEQGVPDGQSNYKNDIINRYTLESEVLSFTLGSHLPFMFSPMQFSKIKNAHNIYMCRFDSESIDFSQVAGRSTKSSNDNLFDFELKFSETW